LPTAISNYKGLSHSSFLYLKSIERYPRFAVARSSAQSKARGG
jgi:hypothetical protein